MPGRSKPASLAGAVWLNESLLLVLCEFDEASSDLSVEAGVDGNTIGGSASSFRFRRFEQQGRSRVETLAIVEFPRRRRLGGRRRARACAAAARSWFLGRRSCRRRLVPSTSSCSAGLSPLQGAARRALHELVLDACAPQLEGPDAGSLAKNLQRLRNVLRERGRERVNGPDEPLNHDVDRIMAVDDRAFWIRGWMRDERGAATGLTAISPEGFSAELLADAFRHQRPDIEQAYGSSGMETAEKHGLMSYFELPAPSRIGTGWLTKVETAGGGGMEGGTPEVIADFAAVRELILRDTKEDDFRHDLMERHAHPALSRMQERLRRSVEVDTVIEYGPQPASPAVTVIVPLYGRIDFLHHQISQFVHDPEIAGLDLLYVLDSPELARDLNKVAAGLHEFYELPFRVAILSRNGGFSLANNLAASVARGRTLLLLNSDVLPTRPRWISRMSAFYDATPNIGALGRQAALRGRLASARGHVLRARVRVAAVGQPALPEGLRPQLRSGQRRQAGAGGDRRLPDDRPRPLRGAGRPGPLLRAGWLRGLRPLPEADRAGAPELVPAAGRAVPPRAAVLPDRRRVPLAGNALQHLASDAPLARSDRRADDGAGHRAARSGCARGLARREGTAMEGTASASGSTLHAEGVRLRPWHLNVSIGPGLSTRDFLEEEAARTPGSFYDPTPGFSWLLRRLYPDGLEGRSVLDCACNCGAYLFLAKELGAGECLGFDVREHWIEQARFLARNRSARPTGSASRSATSTTSPRSGWSASTSCCSGASSTTCPIRSRGCGWPPT